ncbi:T9SS type A sorting domain-containing protein [Hymenobacter aquaticus]|uniref:T9SS type A sorting domain-containing protein n=1 Tax=Hymenobacter aquaticus TaxID=1867101 RepID=A0A4Z0Q7K3_9BACT|nr:T9SS type A sorting domain-containing protein [Hymenobacter aquaticus]TGE25654.1 T9SS type A sorting domain-containing protein [Hymenobacter aquaticus]
MNFPQASLSGTAAVRATTLNSAGDVLVVGTFTGQVAFGATLLTSVGGTDMFVAKYNAAAATWTWAVAGGGTGSDIGQGVAVSGTSIYVTGGITSNSANAQAVRFGNVPLAGRSSTISSDLFVASFTDAGPTATCNWAVAAGGTGADQGNAVAVSGTSVYVTGSITNNAANDQTVLVGNTSLAGASASNSADMVLASYLDQGPSASYQWAVAGGGTGADQANAVAVNGSNVYVAGAVTNNGAGASGVQFGGVTLAGASSNTSTGVAVSTDFFLARYTSTGTSVAYNWAVAGGGIGADQANGLAVSGTSVYVTGSYTNTSTNTQSVRVGGAAFNGLTTALSAELLLARYTDVTTSATFNWATRGGGRGNDAGQAVVVSGTSLYVAGSITNSDTNSSDVRFDTFAVPGASANASAEALVARYEILSNGASCSWARAGGGTGPDAANGLTVTGAGVRLGLGIGTGPALYGSLRALSPNAAGVATLSTAGAWQSAVATRTAGGTLSPSAVTTNATGEVLVTGELYGQVLLGSELYVSMGSGDAFVGKFSPATGTWVWLLSGGSEGDDSALHLAVSGANVYVAGTYAGSSLLPAQFGSYRLYGAGQSDALVVKCVDEGSSARWAWAAGGGGNSYDYGTDVAVSGTSVYLTGNFYNNNANANNVYFGSQPLPGVGGIGVNAFVAKFTDGGTGATCAWATAAGSLSGSSYACYGRGIAAVGSSVYVTGEFTNNLSDGGSMRFGGVALPGASPTSSSDAFLVKYTDAGTRATFTWGRAIGGTSTDYGTALLASGTRLYLTGSVFNSRTIGTNVQVAGIPLAGATADTGDDVLLARFTDQGSSPTLDWAQADGGSGRDRGIGLALGNGRLYVTGHVSNNASNSGRVQLGGVPLAGTQAAYSQDLFVARYTDAGSAATGDWALAGGSPGSDDSYAVAVNAQGVYVTSWVQPPATFGSILLPGSGSSYNAVLATLTEPLIPLSVRSGRGAAALSVYPNPTAGLATLTGADAGADVAVFDAQGRRVLVAVASAAGEARLHLPRGLYLVRSGSQAVRLVVE